MHVCIKCLKEIEKGEKVSKLTPVGFATFKKRCKDWSEIGMHKTLFERITDLCFLEGMICHKNCYGSITNISNIKKAVQSYNRKEKCIFCQDPKDELHNISTVAHSKKMYLIKSNSSCDATKNELSMIKDELDALTFSTKYHKSCLITEWRQIVSSKGVEPFQMIQFYESEIVDMVKDIVVKENKAIDSNQIQEHFKLILQRDGFEYDNSCDYMRYIKDLLQNDPELSSSIDFFNVNFLTS